MTYYELVGKRDKALENYNELYTVVLGLENAIQGYNDYKIILVQTYGSNGEIIQDIRDKLTEAKNNYREGYQAGDDSITPTIDGLLENDLANYSEFTTDFLGEIDTKIQEMESKYTSLQSKLTEFENDYNKYQRKLNNGEYEQI